MLNVAAVPILNITLRNNLLDVIPVKKWIKSSGRCMCLMNDQKKSVKGMWSIILTLPVIVIVLLTRDVQAMVTYTGGFCGAFILIFIPTTLVFYARRCDKELTKGENPNASPFKSMGWIIFTYIWGSLVIIAVIIKIASGSGGE
jgi:hypothetical protein